MFAAIAVPWLVQASAGAAPFEGRFVTGVEVGEGFADLEVAWLQLLDTARRQYDSQEIEMQSINQLYRGDWDGVMEGPTWGAWWTQNSFGPTMGGLPFMSDVTFAAHLHSMRWWFDSIGDGHSQGFSKEGPAPDGCLCDAAVPCPVGGDTCAWYKQGDGLVPLHDWTIEETLSGVMMQAEMLLIARNVTGSKHFLPLFLRTSNLLESRRDPATDNVTFLTGPSTNLLAPSFGGGPNASRAYLAGVSITYAAALNRVIEVAALARNTTLQAEFTTRRDLTMQGLGLFLAQRNNSATEAAAAVNPSISSASNKRATASKQRNVTGMAHYFVRSIDPVASGSAVHGVIGQPQFGYFEASPNHDAVAWRVVNGSLAEEIMSTIDALGDAIRPNVFILPNTDAGGGGGYDDMLCPDGSTWCNGHSRGGIFAYGDWVNGGVWITQEARAILAYYRTGRTDAVAASYNNQLRRYVNAWKLDAPLTHFGADTWAHLPIMLTIDAFGCPAAVLRGLFEYLYTATSLTLVPHVPDTLIELQQKFSVRWGPYRLFITTQGVRSSGIASVSVNGTAVPAANSNSSGHSFNSSALVLDFSSMPTPSGTAAAATESDVSTASDNIFVNISFAKQAVDEISDSQSASPAPGTVQGGSVGDLPAGYILRLSASNLTAHKAGDPVLAWTSQIGTAPTTFAVPPGLAAPTYQVDNDNRSSVVFGEASNGTKCALEAKFSVPAASTVFAVMRDDQSENMFAPIVHLNTDRGLTVSPRNCAQGNPPGPHPCTAHNARSLAIDYAGSPDFGKRNISGETVVSTVAYGSTNATSWVDGCSEQAFGEVVSVPPVADATAVALGLRLDGYNRQFRGAVHEVVVYPTTLNASTTAAVVLALRLAHAIPKRDCGTVAPPTPSPAPASPPRPSLNCTALRTTLNCNSNTWPRKCGLNSTEEARLESFISKLEANGQEQIDSLPYAMAQEALEYTRNFDSRCTGLNNGSVLPLLTTTANEQSLTLMLTTGGNLFAGLDNALTNRYSHPDAEALAQAIAAEWAATRDAKM